MRIKRSNMFDQVQSKPVHFYLIDSASELRAFIDDAHQGFLQSDKGEFAFKKLLIDFRSQLNLAIEDKLYYGLNNSNFLETKILPIFEDAIRDCDQAINYKYYPIKLFNKLYGVDSVFKEFVIKRAIGFSKDNTLGFDPDLLIADYQKNHSIPYIDANIRRIQKKYIQLLLLAFGDKRMKPHRAKLLGATTQSDFIKLYRIIYPIFNEVGNREFDWEMNRKSWGKQGDSYSQYTPGATRRRHGYTESDEQTESYKNFGESTDQESDTNKSESRRQKRNRQ